jgi:L-seryl-tRNA(Ser) seleniumtransferase
MSFSMSPAGHHDSAAAALYRQIPSLDELLARPALAALAGEVSRELVVETARRVLDELRARIARDPEGAEIALAPQRIEQQIVLETRRALDPSLRAVINATGVVLHTNLGRAPLSPAAIEHLQKVSAQYSNLEYDLAARARGKRDVHTAGLLTRLLGAEAAIVLNTLARDGQVIVSRGELIEIGDGFRIPEIMAASGAALCEVGTTNRTRISDYERAINERSRLLLRVHPSNFKVVGFTERASLEELAELGRRSGLPVFEDLGSGCMTDLTACGVGEPEAKASLARGATLVAFSGDKLLGGPQAGIIAGKRDVVERIRRNPLFRALRVDKLTISVLESTLLAYLSGKLDEIPALRMIRMSAEEIERRSLHFIERLKLELPVDEVEVDLRRGESVIGGGSTPDQSLPTWLVTISTVRCSAQDLAGRLHDSVSPDYPPVIARVEDDRLVIDLRTVFPEQEWLVVKALALAMA